MPPTRSAPTRRTLVLRPKRATLDGPRYLTRDLPERWSENEAEGVTLTMFARPTLGEQPRLDRELILIAGGPEALEDTQAGLLLTRLAVERELVAIVWPDGRPEPETPDEREAQEEQLNAAFRVHRSPIRSAHLGAREIADRVAFLAHYAILHVPTSTPRGWESVADLELSMEAGLALVDAWRAAQEDYSLGNG